MRVSKVKYNDLTGSKFLVYMLRSRSYDWGTEYLSEKEKNTLDQNDILYYKELGYSGMSVMFTEEHPMFNLALLLGFYELFKDKNKVKEDLIDLLESLRKKMHNTQ
jgi:hypothetical protein